MSLAIFMLLITGLSIAVITVCQVIEDYFVSFHLLITFSSFVMLSSSLCFKSSKTLRRTCNDNLISYHLSLILSNGLNSSYSSGVSFNILVISEIITNKYYNKLSHYKLINDFKIII